MEWHSTAVGATGERYEGPPLEDPLRFDATISRHMVHRASLAEVFPTGMTRIQEARFLIAAQWPRRHFFYTGTERSPDSALMAETLRQAVILLAHGCGVPLDHKFLMPRMSLQVVPALLDPLRPAEVILETTADAATVRSGNLAELDVTARFRLTDGTVLGEGGAAARMLDAATYRRFRAARMQHESLYRTPRRLDPAAVGHQDPRNVVLGVGRGAGVWPLVVDTAHPAFFDHPLDHVPGMLLLEAVRQAVRLGTGRPGLDVTAFTADFGRIVELWHDPELELTLLSDTEAVAVISHAGQQLAKVRAGWA
ncbi:MULTISPECIES: ScbA/BarX family gamma-butyrolactone biosynthesis protein [Arthrobacter]|uniref:ScbA/BarX family gamma-butyrolactone biosynthesis protein n=2 Tax=Arthrobacter TaxID=1663 RepID=A0ABU9KHN2_9MICC|nr:ScbA/BarX family gamma-butyrolactone biosynthesis protein [Arthrobacter sp. YJM1]MDP5225707.1 ScbA/BarX family gamma-butyrolactone biosynthesis protein [Arthrobacter sp. YJM1]